MANELTIVEKQKTLSMILDSRKGEIAKILPKHLTPERLIRICLSAASRNPVLLECTHESLLKGIMTAGQLGIEPDGILGMGHLVPFKNNKTQKMEATFILGYRGCLDLARRSGDIQTIETGVVHKHDKFEIEFGLDRKLRHVPAWELSDPGETIAVYAIATLKDGTKQIEVMSRAQIDAIRARSKAGNYGPWVSDYDEMARKTVVKRIAKTLPISIEYREGIFEDETREFSPDVIDIVPVQNEVVDKSDKIAKLLSDSKKSKVTEKPNNPQPKKEGYPQEEKQSYTQASEIQKKINEIPWPGDSDAIPADIAQIEAESVFQKKIENNYENRKDDNSKSKITQDSRLPPLNASASQSAASDATGKVIASIDSFLSGKHGEMSIMTTAILSNLKNCSFTEGDNVLLIEAVRKAQGGNTKDLDSLLKARKR
jgi:recombination protein RecT